MSYNRVYATTCHNKHTHKPSGRCEGLTVMLLNIEVFCGVTVCLLGYTATITSENNSLLRDSEGIYRTDFNYLASKNAT
jgi:hypothetical protein